MNKKELISKYLEWATGLMIYAHPTDIDSAVSLSEYDIESSEERLTGIQVLAITKHRRGTVHIFIFTHKITWFCDELGDPITDKVIEEQYEIISTISH